MESECCRTLPTLSSHLGHVQLLGVIHVQGELPQQSHALSLASCLGALPWPKGWCLWLAVPLKVVGNRRGQGAWEEQPDCGDE